ncbi:MAG TPA: hypothetical protein VMF31_08215 [Solirubrobacterales bacterium]|nr:hypothetical protein [Solirubrobacterales bacterium]
MPPISSNPRHSRHPKKATALATILLALAVAWLTFGSAARAAECPDIISASEFTSKAQLRKMTAKFNSFGPRVLASASHNRSIDWLESQARSMGLKTHSKYFKPYAWLPKTRFRNKPGLDISSAGGLSVRKADGSTVNIADAGAVHWSKSTGKSGRGGELVYVPPGEEITPENSAGKIVIRDFKLGSIPFGLLTPLLGIYQSPDLEGYTEYSRPYLSPTAHKDSIAAGIAGAAGVIFAFDVPQKQIRGYYDPHTGTIYRQPQVFVGSAQATRLKSLAAAGSTARVSVQAEIGRRVTRNLIARLPGKSTEKIVLAANTDGNSWVQENGVIAMLAFARYYAKLPLKCRPRTLEMVFSTAHDAYRNDGLDPKHYPLAKKKIAFAFAIEHLGTREILPTGEGADRRLEFTGQADPALFAAGDSEILRETAVAVAKNRRLPRTAVLKGVGVPNAAQAPSVCSMGGLGNFFHPSLVPTLAMISGPWSLYDPAFGSKAIDFAQMRSQTLAIGDSILALDGLPREQIAGDYPALQAELDAGTKSPCPKEVIPLHAPGPGA